MLSVRKRLAVAAAAAGLVSVAGYATPAQAYPLDQPPCYGASCVGKDPNIRNRQGVSCASTAVDVVTVTWVATYVLRWSDWCHANWVKSYLTVSTGGTAPNNCCWFYAQTYDGHQEWGNGAYTNMVDGSQLARMVYEAEDGDPNDGYYTGWY
ncbi:MAG: hypothetical protein ACJ73S_27845 [Mycobacteriales bacterium]